MAHLGRPKCRSILLQVSFGLIWGTLDKKRRLFWRPRLAQKPQKREVPSSYGLTSRGRPWKRPVFQRDTESHSYRFRRHLGASWGSFRSQFGTQWAPIWDHVGDNWAPLPSPTAPRRMFHRLLYPGPAECAVRLNKCNIMNKQEMLKKIQAKPLAC